MTKKFISVIWGYHKQIFTFDKKQNYHMISFEAMSEEGYNLELFSIDSQVKIEKDPNLIKGIKVIYYKNFIQYILYLIKNRNNIIYSNTLTIKSLIIGIIGKKTIFYPHATLFGHGNLIFIKRIISRFFYKFFTKIRINNTDEEIEINKLKSNLAYKLPLSISEDFLNTNLQNRNNIITWIGNLTPVKNPLILIDLAKKIKKEFPNYKIQIIGEDRYEKYTGINFTNLIKINNLSDTIILTGFKTANEIKTLLAESLIYLNTSIAEGQCLAVYEGALAGNALCLANILAFPSVFGKNALYHNNVDELFANIKYYIENKEERINSIKENQEFILKNYNYNYIKEETKRMFLSIDI